jgi:hypothetical protein
LPLYRPGTRGSPCFGTGTSLDQRLAIAGDHNLFPGKRAFDQARERGLRLMHVDDLGHRGDPSS